MDLETQTERTPFTIDNLPYGVISTVDNPLPRCATALGEHAIDLSKLESTGLFDEIPGFEHGSIFSQGNLNTFAALPRTSQTEVRRRLVEFLSNRGPSDSQEKCFVPLAQVQNHLPMASANYSDFYCSLEHAKNCAELIDLPIFESWYVIPSVYNGRTSSLRVSGTPIRRPSGMIQAGGFDSSPVWCRSQKIDFELEMGVYVSKTLAAGEILDIETAGDYIFGFVILNDWSARDIQAYEMAPLGPFHCKGFGTTISPWIVPMDALKAVECAGTIPQNPPPPSHLRWRGSSDSSTFDIELSASILRNGKKYLVTSTNLKELYWTPYQQITHLSSGGEGLTSGDVFGTGTISSDGVNQEKEKIGLACLLERQLPGHELCSLESAGLTWLEDGDEVIMEGWCFNRGSGNWFGFGECRGRIVPALV